MAMTGDMSTEEVAQPEALVSVLEALASNVAATGPNMSNRSTPTAADADDQ